MIPKDKVRPAKQTDLNREFEDPKRTTEWNSFFRAINIRDHQFAQLAELWLKATENRESAANQVPCECSAAGGMLDAPGH
jgi:hypothetical protein